MDLDCPWLKTQLWPLPSYVILGHLTKSRGLYFLPWEW